MCDGQIQSGQKRLKFTVVTAVINSEKVIGKTIESVLGQTLPPYEYLIIDGRSADRTVAIAESYAPLFAKKGVKYFVLSEKDRGCPHAMNKGIDWATGDFISFLNAGDWYEADALKKVQALYDEEPFDLTYGGIYYHTPDGKVRTKMSRLDHFPISTRNWNHPSMFLRRELYSKHKFDEDLGAIADVGIYLALRKNGVKIRIMNDIIANFVTGGFSNDPDIKLCLKRAAQRYRAYRKNGYSCIYWFEAYGWEFLKSLYMRWHS